MWGSFSEPEMYGARAWWRTTCKSDPRFNMSGDASGISDASAKIDAAIEAKIAELGLTPEQVPEDIEYTGGKT